jgi:hypothetical protein
MLSAMSSSSEKDLAQSSATGGRKLVPFDRIDTPDDTEDNCHNNLGAPRNDANDMERMGKTQELRV